MCLCSLKIKFTISKILRVDTKNISYSSFIWGLIWRSYHISSNNSQGWLFFLRTKWGRLFEGGDYFKWFSLEFMPLEVFCFIITWNQKTITSNKLNLGFFIVPNLVPWLIFRAWFVTDQFCHVTFQFNNDREGGDKRKRRWYDGWGRGWLFEGGDFFKNFQERRAIIWGRRLIEDSYYSRKYGTSQFLCI